MLKNFVWVQTKFSEKAADRGVNYQLHLDDFQMHLVIHTPVNGPKLVRMGLQSRIVPHPKEGEVNTSIASVTGIGG